MNAAPFAARTYRRLGLIAVFTLAMFVSAALLFLLEPMFAKMVLPLLGGTPQVWNTAVVFYQMLLLMGYIYAHVVTARLGARWQIAVHAVLILLPFLVLPAGVPAGWIPPTEANPIPWLLALMMVAVGLPLFVVSTTSPLLQLWFAATEHPAAQDPYFLYGASNLGSMLGLLAYPFLLEPALRLGEQSRLWTLGYGVLVACLLACAAIVWRSRGLARKVDRPTSVLFDSGDSRIKVTRRLRWVIWAFVPSSLMLSVTTYMSTDIAAVPLLWITPLSIYLLTFVLAFARKPIFPQQRMVWRARLWVLPVLITIFAGAVRPMWLLLPLHLIVFFIVAMASHGALAHDRPPARHLTEFYLCISIGGALGGLFNALLAPVLFTSVLEYRLVLALAALSHLRRQDISSQPSVRRLDLGLPVALGAMFAAMIPAVRALGLESDINAWRLMFASLGLAVVGLSRRPIRASLAIVILMLVSIAQTAGVLWTDLGGLTEVVHANRSFFGVHRVVSVEEIPESYHLLIHGTTLHGAQSLAPARRREPLTYYHRTGPIGQMFEALNGGRAFQEVAVVGLGAGSLACYSQPGQRWTFYEIDPHVARTALDPRFFTFLQECTPQAWIVLGDGRLSLTKAVDRQFDLIVIDAFSSDSIPVHLMGRESLALYLKKLAPHGLLAYHVSNRYMELAPVLANLALDANVTCLTQHDREVSEEDSQQLKTRSEWVIMARAPEDLGSLADDLRWQKLEGQTDERVWTDDFSSITSVLRWR